MIYFVKKILEAESEVETRCRAFSGKFSLFLAPTAALMDVLVDVYNDLKTDKPYADAVNQLKQVTGGSFP